MRIGMIAMRCASCASKPRCALGAHLLLDALRDIEASMRSRVFRDMVRKKSKPPTTGICFGELRRRGKGATHVQKSDPQILNMVICFVRILALNMVETAAAIINVGRRFPAISEVRPFR
jgi:hypothetical protein